MITRVTAGKVLNVDRRLTYLFPHCIVGHYWKLWRVSIILHAKRSSSSYLGDARTNFWGSRNWSEISACASLMHYSGNALVIINGNIFNQKGVLVFLNCAICRISPTEYVLRQIFLEDSKLFDYFIEVYKGYYVTYCYWSLTYL